MQLFSTKSLIDFNTQFSSTTNGMYKSFYHYSLLHTEQWGQNIFSFLTSSKAELLQVGIFFLIHLCAWEILLLKKLEMEETKTT